MKQFFALSVFLLASAAFAHEGPDPVMHWDFQPRFTVGLASADAGKMTYPMCPSIARFSAHRYVPPPTPADAKVIRITDFGIRPNDRQNAVKAVRAAIEACRGKEGMTILFPKGRYDFWAQDSEEIDYYESNTTDNNPKICPIVLKGIKGLTMDGNGSEFICHGRMQPFTLEECEDVTVKNLDIDWDIPFVAQARIMKVERDSIEIQLNPTETPYEILGGKIFFHGEGWKSGWWGCMEFEDGTRIIPQQSGDAPLGNGWNRYRAEELGDGLVRLNHDFKRKPKVGNYLIGCKNIDVSSNKIAADVLGRNIAIVNMEQSEVKVGSGQGIAE